jgi:replicative DNA helicase
LILPHNTEAEIQVLGSLLLGDSEEQEYIIGKLSADDFYSRRMGNIFQACFDLFVHGDVIDLMTVSNVLGQDSVNMLATITAKVLSSSNCKFYADMVKDYSDKRKFIVLANGMIKNCSDAAMNAPDIISEHDSELFKITSGYNQSDYSAISKVALGGISRLEKAMQSGTGITGVQCYYRDIDILTAGFQAQDMIILAARPSVGKTSLAINFAYNMATHGHPIGFFSLEMSSVSLWRRLISMNLRIDGMKMISGKVSDQEMGRVVNSNVNSLPIFIDESSGSTVASIRSKARMMVRKEKVEMIFIDYIGLINPGGKFQNRNAEISYISASIKDLAKELNIPVMILSQLSRDSAKAKLPPTLTDLRDSGSLEQDADMVIFIYRPHFAGIMEYSDHRSTENVAEIIIAKFRNGKTGAIEMVFNGEHGRFSAVENNLPDNPDNQDRF